MRSTGLLCSLGLLLARVAGKSAPTPVELPYVLCETCEWVVSVASTLADMAERKGVVLDDLGLEESFARICAIHSEEGRWLQYLDIVEEDSVLRYSNAEEKMQSRPRVLKLKEIWDGRGECRDECHLLSRICRVVQDDHLNVDGLLGAIWRGERDGDALKKRFCRGKGKPCADHPKRLPEGFTRTDEAFKIMRADEAMFLDRVAASEKPKGFDAHNEMHWAMLAEKVEQEMIESGEFDGQERAGLDDDEEDSGGMMNEDDSLHATATDEL